ncbi:hypothetical protein [Riemerella anatipestifer]|uniref:hypothetical protein n=1 Tax=Riemerella anatipestifer TaxID=34085 RepID=UPI0021F8BEA3|nr:hypothetical protein [Riemerella anatipestifer]MCW0488323.1 hypothetical protein [Riemerella anatipestifer]
MAELSFKDKYVTPLTRGYKDFVQEMENTSPEQFYMDGEREFTPEEKKYLKIYNHKQGIITQEQEQVERINPNIENISSKALIDANYFKNLEPNTQKEVEDYLEKKGIEKITVHNPFEGNEIDFFLEKHIIRDLENLKTNVESLQEGGVKSLKIAEVFHQGDNELDVDWLSKTNFNIKEIKYNLSDDIRDWKMEQVNSESLNNLSTQKSELFISTDYLLEIINDKSILFPYLARYDEIDLFIEPNNLYEINSTVNEILEINLKENNKMEVSEKVESLIGQIANTKLDDNLGHKIKLFNELSDTEKAFFKENAKEIAIVNIAEIQEGISDEEKQTISQKFDNFFEQIQEQPKKTYEQEEVIGYLKNQLMYLGFGKDEKLHKDLEKGVLETQNGEKFQIATKYDKVLEGNEAHFIINFHKSEQGGVYLNSFKGVLKEGNTGEERIHSFGANKFTAKEAINLLEGRAVKTQFTNKLTNEQDDVFVKLKLKEEKNEFGNYQMQMYNKGYGINTEDIVNKSQLVFDGENAEEIKELVIKSLEKGNVVNVKFRNDDNKEMQGKAILNPQYKTINLYDEQMNRINTNKPIRGLEADRQQEKSNAREYSRGRNPH